MIVNKKKKLLHKKLVRLKVNPLNNNKFLELMVESERTKVIYKNIGGQIVKTEITIKRFAEMGKQKKEKWNTFLRFLQKANTFFRKYRPYTFNYYDVSKFASQGNSYKKFFKKNLLTKKTFNHFYGGFQKKYFKKQMAKIYMSPKMKNSSKLCIEFFESRLDSVLKRAKLCSTIKEARQLIYHRHIKVNRKIENNYSYQLHTGDLIHFKNKKSREFVKIKLLKQFKERFDSVLWPMVPSYLNVNYTTLEIIFGNIEHFNFSSSFPFKNDISSIVGGSRWN